MNVPCGRCRLCRKRVANDWKVRLYNEFAGTATHHHCGIEQPRVAFVTFTFSDEFYTDDNSLFADYLVTFRDNFRKRFGKSPRYWAVTDRGAKNGRLHLHMLLFNPYDYIKDKPVSVSFLHSVKMWWPYGFVEVVWVRKGLAGANYVVGYVTCANIEKDAKKHGITMCELAQKHKPKIYCSKGLGKSFDTRQNYEEFRRKMRPLVSLNGYNYGLPRYYKYKWFSRSERYEMNKTFEYETLQLYKEYGYSADFVQDIFGGVNDFYIAQLSGTAVTDIPFEFAGKRSTLDLVYSSIKELSRFDSPEKPFAPYTLYDMQEDNVNFPLLPFNYMYADTTLPNYVKNDLYNDLIPF